MPKPTKAKKAKAAAQNRKKTQKPTADKPTKVAISGSTPSPRRKKKPARSSNA